MNELAYYDDMDAEVYEAAPIGVDTDAIGVYDTDEFRDMVLGLDL